MDRRKSLKNLILGSLSLPALNFPSLASGKQLTPLEKTGPAQWQKAYPITGLSPKRKLGGLVRFNDPSFFAATQGKIVTQKDRFKRHRTMMFPQWDLQQYPYSLRVTMRKRDIKEVKAGLIFGAKTPYEFELGGKETHGALFAYVNGEGLEFRDHRTDGTKIWKNGQTPLSKKWQPGEKITLTLSEVDYQQRIWDVFAANDALRELHGNVPSAFKGGDHEFANASPLQPGGLQGHYYPEYIKNACKAISLDGFEPVAEDEVSYISKPIPGWIEIFHIVTRYDQTVNIADRKFPNRIDETNEQSPSGTIVMEKLEEWARNSPAPFKIVHGDHPLGDIRTVSAKETYRLYPWERRKLVRLIAETGLLYAIGDEHNLRLVRYHDFSGTRPHDPLLVPLKNVNIYEIGISNLSGEWFRRLREGKPSGEGIHYEVLHQTPDRTAAITHGFQPWNGYTVFRFNKNERKVRFEIWKRKGEDQNYRGKDPRKEEPDYAMTIDPGEIFWQTSGLPEIDLQNQGFTLDKAKNSFFSVKDSEGQVIFSNRADHRGKISGFSCPPFAKGDIVKVAFEKGPELEVKTV